ncbi:MAG: extracellular solute-binding protein [Bacilli bacterium]|nr:extracellular solute-binding protein [Bacilli bacterium]
MSTKKLNLTRKVLPFFLALAPISLTSCGENYDVVLTVYNWEDYIYDGTDEMGNIDEENPGVVELFEEYYQEKTGKKIKVDYETFSTNEEMYQQIKLNSIAPDLICPSDYMIQKMANEGLLEEFSYNEASNTYGESLDNWSTNGSPFLKDRFANEKLNNGKSFLSYAVPYFWGTMGFTYDPEYFDPEEVSTWECLWNSDSHYKKQFSLKDSMRDTYVAAIFHVYKDEIAALDESADDYNSQLSAIFNRCDAQTIAKVKEALIEAKRSTVYGFEVDEGKDDIVRGNYHANLAWSGDSVYSMDSAEESNKFLNYSLPEEGSNIWFDGWCMPKGANKEVAEEFVNFISSPEIAALSMDAVGYTSSIAGQEIWDLVKEWYEETDSSVEVDVVDLSYFFEGTFDGAKTIKVSKEERGRQFDAQYPSVEQIKKCCIMKDFGDQTSAVEDMWQEVGQTN